MRRSVGAFPLPGEPDEPPAQPGALMTERSLFNIGFYIGLGFFSVPFMIGLVLFVVGLLLHLSLR